jgi:cell wall-associated NlpC family hydrolase
MMWAYGECGISIPRTTYGQMAACSAAGHLFYDTSQLQPGDLVFTNGGGHVAMYLSEGKVVHDPSPGGVVMVSPLTRWSSITCCGFPVA